MAGATLWLVLTVTGFALLRFMGDIRSHTLQAVFVRLAAFAFVGAGLIGASGWLGSLFSSGVTLANQAGASAGAAALGTGAVWIIWAAMALAWILTLLPETWFGRSIPDWLSISGLFLPSLVQSVPGPIGDFFRAVIRVCGQFMTNLMSKAFGS